MVNLYGAQPKTAPTKKNPLPSYLTNLYLPLLISCRYAQLSIPYNFLSPEMGSEQAGQ